MKNLAYIRFYGLFVNVRTYSTYVRKGEGATERGWARRASSINLHARKNHPCSLSSVTSQSYHSNPSCRSNRENTEKCHIRSCSSFPLWVGRGTKKGFWVECVCVCWWGAEGLFLFIYSPENEEKQLFASLNTTQLERITVMILLPLTWLSFTHTLILYIFSQWRGR